MTLATTKCSQTGKTYIYWWPSTATSRRYDQWVISSLSLSNPECLCIDESWRGLESMGEMGTAGFQSWWNEWQVISIEDITPSLTPHTLRSYIPMNIRSYFRIRWNLVKALFLGMSWRSGRKTTSSSYHTIEHHHTHISTHLSAFSAFTMKQSTSGRMV